MGRATQLRQISEALLTARAVTLTGPGGVGKSRLAVEFGWKSLAQYPGGVWLVSFDSVSDPAQLPHSMAEAVVVPEVCRAPQRAPPPVSGCAAICLSADRGQSRRLAIEAMPLARESKQHELVCLLLNTLGLTEVSLSVQEGRDLSQNDARV